MKDRDWRLYPRMNFDQQLASVINTGKSSRKRANEIMGQKVPILDFDTFNLRYRQGFQWAYEFFSDSISKNVIATIAAMHLGLAPPPENHEGEGTKYFLRGMSSPAEDEIFVDGGFFIGDTAHAFLKLTGNRFVHYYGFDPSQVNLGQSFGHLHNDDRISIINKALWSCETWLPFDENGTGGSRIEKGGAQLAEAVSLDWFFKGFPFDELPTFIKLDVEKAEKHAIMGAKKIILDRSPRLVVCLYHRIEDIYELPRLIHEINPCYEMRIRHHDDTGFLDTVLYCF